MKLLVSSLYIVKVGKKIIEFARAVTNSSPAKVRRLKFEFIAGTEEKGILDQMLSIFQANCPFYEVNWYEMQLSLC